MLKEVTGCAIGLRCVELVGSADPDGISDTTKITGTLHIDDAIEIIDSYGKLSLSGNWLYEP